MDSISYYFLVASQDFFFYQEPIEEILRERIRHYKSIEKDLDFSFTTNLDFLNEPDLVHIRESLIKPSAAIVSLNPKFINWLKLRVQYGVTGNFVSSSLKRYNSLFLSKQLSII